MFSSKNPEIECYYYLKPNTCRLSHPNYQLDKSILNLRVVGCDFFNITNQNQAPISHELEASNDQVCYYGVHILAKFEFELSKSER